MKKYLSLSLAICIIFIIIVFVFYEDSNEETTQSNQTEDLIMQSEETSESETEMHEELSLKDSLLMYLDEEITNEAIDILENKIGFSDIQFIEKEGTGNYNLKANGFNICMIAYSEDCVYRVFIPNSNHTFYEDGNLLETYEDFNMKNITQDEMSRAWIISKEIIEKNLKNPKSAKFPSFLTSNDIYFQKYGDMIAVKSYVNAENSFGGIVKSTFIVEFVVTNWEMFEYEILYIKIDNDSYGTWVELN